MTPLPPPLGAEGVVFWRVDAERYAATWETGEGSFQVGGRWNAPGVRTIYASLDPATAILEVAVHKGFQVLDTQPHILTSARIIDPSKIHVVRPEDIPNPNWLSPAMPNINQQQYGNALLAEHRFVLIPSVVSKNSWNLIFDANKDKAEYTELKQDRLSIDPRLPV